MGVSVSEMMTETAMVKVTVTANSRNSRPTMPPISSSGMNTATSETEMEIMVKPISLAPLSAACVGVIDHEADRNRQRHQRQIIEAVAGQIHHARRAHQRQRHGNAGDQRGSH